MKRILFLLLLTVSVYGQNPSRFAKIQITGNSNSGTATKVNVQEANGEVNTQTINTGFNKNIGLGGSDVVGATTLLNQYSTTPIDWTSTYFSSGQVVFYGGKQWIAKIATVAGDVPAVSSKWEEITFEALANKTVTVDQTIIDGSTNAVSGNAVFDALATKAPISSVHNPVTLGAANGLSLSEQQLSLGLASSGTTGALSGTDWNTFNGKFNTPTGLTTNYLPKWNGSGFGNSSIFDNGTRVGIGTDLPQVKLSVHGMQSNTISTTTAVSKNVSGDIGLFIGGLAGMPNYGNWLQSMRESDGLVFPLSIQPNGGNVGIGTTSPSEKLEVAGTIKATSYTGSATLTGTPTAPTAAAGTNTTQIATTAFVQAAARPYKVYTALLSQTGTNAPTATVLENTLGGTVVWSRVGVGTYVATLTGAFTTSKTITFGTFGNVDNPSLNTLDFQHNSVNSMFLITRVSGIATDSVMDANTSIEIRVYL